MASKPQKYSLKTIETQVLLETQKQFQVLVSNLLSMVAIERLAYEVKPETQFSVSPDFKSVEISEPEKAEVITNGSASKAMKGKK